MAARAHLANTRETGSCLAVLVGSRPVADLAVVLAELQARHRRRCDTYGLCPECVAPLRDHPQAGHVPWILPAEPEEARMSRKKEPDANKFFMAIGNLAKIPVSGEFQRGDYVKLTTIAKITKKHEEGPLDVPEFTFIASADLEFTAVHLHNRPPRGEELPFDDEDASKTDPSDEGEKEEARGPSGPAPAWSAASAPPKPIPIKRPRRPRGAPGGRK